MGHIGLGGNLSFFAIHAQSAIHVTMSRRTLQLLCRLSRQVARSETSGSGDPWPLALAATYCSGNDYRCDRHCIINCQAAYHPQGQKGFSRDCFACAGPQPGTRPCLQAQQWLHCSVARLHMLRVICSTGSQRLHLRPHRQAFNLLTCITLSSFHQRLNQFGLPCRRGTSSLYTDASEHFSSAFALILNHQNTAADS